MHRTSLLLALALLLPAAGVLAQDKEVTEKIPLRHLKAQDVLAILTQPPAGLAAAPGVLPITALPSGIDEARAVPAENAVEVKGSPAALLALRSVVAAMDAPPALVRCEFDFYTLEGDSLGKDAPESLAEARRSGLVVGDAAARLAASVRALVEKRLARLVVSPGVTTPAGTTGALTSTATLATNRPAQTVLVRVVPHVYGKGIVGDFYLFAGSTSGATYSGRSLFKAVVAATDQPVVFWLSATSQEPADVLVVARLKRE